MYRELRIARLHATLWVSVPQAPTPPEPPSTSPDPLTSAWPMSPEVPISPGRPMSTIAPDGCMDLVVLESQLVIAGADSKARMIPTSTSPTVGLRFDSGVLPQLLAASAAELADRVTPFADVVVSASGESVDRLGEAWDRDTGQPESFGGDAVGSIRLGGDAVGSISLGGGMSDSIRALLRLGQTLIAGTEIDPRPLALARALAARLGAAPISIAEVAAAFAYSPRQLRRLSAEWFGYGPKHLAKIQRWTAARRLIDAGHTRTGAAAQTGYADAAQLWRDERALLGR